MIDVASPDVCQSNAEELSKATCADHPLPEIPWYMDLGARGKKIWRDCPADIKEEISFFLDHGYVVLRKSVPEDLVAKATSDFQRHKAKFPDVYQRHADSGGFQRRIVNLHVALDSFKELFSRNERALRVQDYLFQRPSTCYTSLTFESGSEQDMHRDSPYFRTTPEYYYLGVWVALEEIDEKNGGLTVYDGGHLLQEPDREAIYSKYYRRGEVFNDLDARLWDDYQSMVNTQCDERKLQKRVVPMSPGDTLIWHPHLPHGGAEIIERHRSRMSMVTHVVPINVPISGLAVFYGHLEEPKEIRYNYEDFDGRKFFVHNNVEFAHKEAIPAENFRL